MENITRIIKLYSINNRNYKIIELILSGRQITNEIAIDILSDIAEHLKVISSLIDLYLGYNFITDIGAIKLIKNLKFNEKINTLGLSGNPISNEGIIKIAKKLRNNKTLKQIILGSCQITDETIVSMVEYLKFNTSLTILSLFSNQITDIGANVILEFLKFNTNIESVNLKDNFISEQLMILIDNQIKINIFNKQVRNVSLQQRCYDIIKENNITCPDSYKQIYEKID